MNLKIQHVGCIRHTSNVQQSRVGQRGLFGTSKYRTFPSLEEVLSGSTARSYLCRSSSLDFSAMQPISLGISAIGVASIHNSQNPKAEASNQHSPDACDLGFTGGAFLPFGSVPENRIPGSRNVVGHRTLRDIQATSCFYRLFFFFSIRKQSKMYSKQMLKAEVFPKYPFMFISIRIIRRRATQECERLLPLESVLGRLAGWVSGACLLLILGL